MSPLDGRGRTRRRLRLAGAGGDVLGRGFSGERDPRTDIPFGGRRRSHRLGLPRLENRASVSTTHAIAGALAGAGIVAQGAWRLHWSFLKIVALAIVASSVLGISGFPFYAAVALAMGAGSLVAGFRVTETLARKVTPISPAEGFCANFVTTLLVGLASVAALPVSTTHVSSGAIIGIGLHRGAASVRWTTVRDMLVAWLVTLPVAALVGAGAYAILRALT